jgi:hypothetical protein
LEKKNMPFTQTTISEYYVAVFNRASEGEGNQFWQGFDGSASELVDAMLATQAAQDYFGTALDSNQAFVEHIYQNTLGKTLVDDPDGIAFWVGKLDGGESRGSVVEQLVFAAQQPENAGSAQDQFNNRVEVSDYTAENIDTPPADFATSLAFDGDLVVTSDSATVTSAKASIDALDSGSGGGGGGNDGETFMLTTDQDNLTGTDLDDAFAGYIFDNQNTAQSGDMIDGGAGHDSLYADVGSSQNFAITLHTTSVEDFAVRAQSYGGYGADNNIGNEAQVQIDAERMVGTTRYDTDNSRQDLLIEDVRIESSEITKDITVGMIQTDPGDVDYGLYFDQHSLRAAPAVTAGAVLNLEIMDTRSADDGLDPLLENPFDGFTFTLDGTGYVVKSEAIDDATTYTEFLTAIQAALLTVPGLEDFSASITGTFQAIDTVSGNSLTGQVVTLTNAGSGVIEEGNWTTADGTVPSSSGLHLVQDTLPPSQTGNLITSTIILDDVGRGSMGGDLIIGGMSTGETSNSKGVERFDITVERSSQNQEISSTNNTLQEVYIVNGDTKGNLTVAGDTNGDNDIPGSGDGSDPGNGTAGFTDVRLVDASAMEGSVNINAELRSTVTSKYMTLTDDATDETADNVDFIYTLGQNNDSLFIDIDEANLAAAGTTTREDFTFVANGGNGNDIITTLLDTSADDADNWYINSTLNANLMVNGDAGNDTITTTGAGNFSINAGSGDDTVYTDNSGGRATWVVNALNTDLTDLQSDVTTMAAATDQLLYKAKLTVTFSGATTSDTSGVTTGAAVALDKGFESTVEIGTTDHIGNRAQINQAIKEAINGDAVMSKLLSATDGPGNTLVITSLVDGVFTADDIDFDIASYTATAGELTDGSTLDTAWELLNADSTLTVVQGDLDTAATNAALLIDTEVLAAGGTGSVSTAVSDNIVNLGSGDDVAVLGTDDQSNDMIVLSGSSIGNNTIFNFDTDAPEGDGTATNQDSLNVTAYLGGMETLPAGSTSAESATLIATTGVQGTFGGGAHDVEANEVYIFNDFVQDIAGGATETWANLTAAELMAAVKATNVAGADDFGNITEDDLDVGDLNTDLVGSIIKNVIFVENDLNDGEYKVFEVTSNGGTTDEFASATLLGTVDFGDTLLAATTTLI